MNTTKSTTEKSDAELLRDVIEALDITAAKLADKTGYKSPASIYHILNGQNNITVSMAKNICSAYPEVNFLYLTLGKLPILITNQEQQYQALNFDEKPLLQDIPQLLKDIRDLLFEINSKV